MCKMFKANNKDHRMMSTAVPESFFNKVTGFQRVTLLKRESFTSVGVILSPLLLTWTKFHTFFSVSIVDLEQVNIC